MPKYKIGDEVVFEGNTKKVLKVFTVSTVEESSYAYELENQIGTIPENLLN